MLVTVRGHASRALWGVLGMCVVAASGCTHSGDALARFDGVRGETAGPFTVQILEERPPSRVGRNTLLLRIAAGPQQRGNAGEPELVVSMPAMGAMAYMEDRARVKRIGEGIYRADYRLSMHGDWDVRVFPAGDAPGRPVAEYRLTVGVPGIRALNPGVATASRRDSALLVEIPPRVQQSFGVRTSPVTKGPLAREFLAAGVVVANENAGTDIALRTNGRISQVSVGPIGSTVTRGQVLFVLESSSLAMVQEEYLAARRTAVSTGEPPASYATSQFGRARNMLLSNDFPETLLDSLERAGRALQRVPIRAGSNGIVSFRDVEAGRVVEFGQRLLRIESSGGRVIAARVPIAELAGLRVGSSVSIRSPSGDGRLLTGNVVSVSHVVDPASGTGEARLRVAGGGLRVGQPVSATLSVDEGAGLLVPNEAVLHRRGERIAFVEVSPGLFEARTVQVGRRFSGGLEVIEGLREGERVVTSGQFMVAAETELRTGRRQQ